MKDIKVALQAEIEKMESACDEIPFGLDEEDEQCLWVMREALKQLARRDAQLAELAKQEPYAYTFESEAAELESLSGGMCRVWSANCYPNAPIKLYRAAPPAPFVVKAPEFKVHAQHPTMAAGMRDNDWKEAIKAAGGSVADGN